MDNTVKAQLEGKARMARREIFKFKTKAGVGHLASCLSVVDILVSIIYDNPVFAMARDQIIFSKGHGSPAIYPLLADLGLISHKCLEEYCQVGGMLRLHSDKTMPMCHFVGGSLGNGIGYTAGRAMAEPLKTWNVIMGDAELYEGVCWESFAFIAHHNLKNIRIIVDRNGMGILGKTEELLRLEPLESKFLAFGFPTVVSANGHDFDELRWALSQGNDGPHVVIAETIKAKGVSFMEGRWQSHGFIPQSKEDIECGLKELSNEIQ